MPRPLWSVMIPTFHCARFFALDAGACVVAVFSQDPDPDVMQIEVVDDCSNDNTAAEVTRRLGAGRVTFHAESQNRGLVEQSDAGAMFCRYAVANSKGYWLRISELHWESTGLLEDSHVNITIQCDSMHSDCCSEEAFARGIG